MKLKTLVLAGLMLFGSPLLAKTYQALTLAGEVFAAAAPVQTNHTPEEMVAAAESFLKSLTPEERVQALLPLDDPERQKWTNVPTKADDGGLRLGDLTKEQLEGASAFLSTVLSKEGYLMARNVMLADDLLLRSKEQANRRGGFGTANFWIAVFGTPSKTEPWAVQLDGHHIAFNLTIVGEQVSMSPSFIGTQPHRFTLGEEEIVPMGAETEAAYALMASLSEDQKKEAIQGKKRGRMEAGPGADGKKPKQRGLSCETLTQEQRGLLLKLVSLWIDDLPKNSYFARLAEIEAQLDETVFLWQGPHVPGSDASFHIFGPGLIIEYAGQNLGGDPLDHLHSIYRDPTNEYGVKWIGE
ncbi:MAG: DUF3500 domain-containing protein [Roseibacillus sp.]